jgi:hypothetical protein
VVRTFVKLRELLATHKDLAHKLAKLECRECRVGGHGEAIRSLVAAIRELMTPPVEKPRSRIGSGRRRQGSEGCTKR